MAELWMDQAAHNIGIMLNKADTDDILGFVDKATKDYGAEAIMAYRDRVVSNYGKAGEAIALHIQTFILGEER